MEKFTKEIILWCRAIQFLMHQIGVRLTSFMIDAL